MVIAKKHTERLEDLKDSVREWHEYFKDNIERYKKFKRFIYKSLLDDDDIGTLTDLGKPIIEFNSAESFISKARAEFAQNESCPILRIADGVSLSAINDNFIKTLDFLEKHCKWVFGPGLDDSFKYNIYTDMVSGGFAVASLFTDYVNEKSFEQNIIRKRENPLLCAFDPLAQLSHKGDGQRCSSIVVLPKDEFDDAYGSAISARMKYSKDVAGYSWSYKNQQNDEFVIVCDTYEKVKKEAKIMQLTNGHVVTPDEYEKLLEKWDSSGRFEQAPQPVGKYRKTIVTNICRYRFCETDILDYTMTDYNYLPLIFFDGNSETLYEGDTSYQFTRPLVYHLEGIQKLKTFAGQTLANELENMVQHKFIAAVEGIPNDYKEAYKNVQKADVLLYNHFLDTNNPEVTLPPPTPVMRTPIPPEVTNTFRMADEMTQSILGIYDNANGINRADLSGVAIARGTLQSAQSFVPYLVGFNNGLNHLVTMYLDLLPKYWKSPRQVPILQPNGQRSYVVVNSGNSIKMNYDPTLLQVSVETGPSFLMQKELALQTIINLMQASPAFAQFMNQEGLPMLLDNIDIRGIDELKEKADKFMKQMQQQQQQQGQLQQQQLQLQMQGQQAFAQERQAKSQLAVAQAQQAQVEAQQAMKDMQEPSKGMLDMMKFQHQVNMDSATMTLNEQQAQDNFLQIISQIRSDDINNQINQAKVDAENARSQIDAAINMDAHSIDSAIKIDSHLNPKQEQQSTNV